MPTIHMDVEAVRATQTTMENQQQQLTQNLASVSQAVQSTVGQTWIGQSANEFQQQYEQVRTAMTSQLEQLQRLAQTLKSEIAQWEEVAARLG